MKLKLFLPFALFFIAFGSCEKNDFCPIDPRYDLDIHLVGVGKYLGVGLIKFRQNPDTARIITLSTKVFNLMPYHTYLLQRAVNPITDTTGCSSTVWLTLGEGLLPKSIFTDAYGNGSANLWRNVSAIPRGKAFHIKFQVIDAETLLPILISDCYDYTVR